MFAIVQAAGWPIWFLIVASVVALALIIERGFALRRRRVMPGDLLDEVLRLHRAGQITPQVLQQLDRNSPLGRILATGLRQAKSTRDAMKEAIEETGRAVVHDLERYLSALGTIASTAPLMGLFGTTIGMIEIFSATAPGGGSNPEQLAYGISVALYNTAFGLVVAIPALIFYRHYRARVDGYLVEMEQQALRLVETVRGERR